MYNLGIHFGTSFVFDRIDYDARQQLDNAKSIIFYDAIGCPITVHITGNQTLVQQLAKDLNVARIPYTTGKLPNPKLKDHTHIIPNNR